MVGITAKLMHDLSGGLRHAACIASRGRGKQRTAMAHLMRKESGEREEGAFDVFEVLEVRDGRALFRTGSLKVR
jgi:hypothetical protein